MSYSYVMKAVITDRNIKIIPAAFFGCFNSGLKIAAFHTLQTIKGGVYNGNQLAISL